MFCAVYKFTVKPDQEREFRQLWNSLTRMIRQHQDSLGSRLHRSGAQDYIAYAQWPNRQTWKNPPPLPPMGEELRRRMKECCEKIEVLFELEVVDDLLG